MASQCELGLEPNSTGAPPGHTNKAGTSDFSTIVQSKHDQI